MKRKIICTIMMGMLLTSVITGCGAVDNTTNTATTESVAKTDSNEYETTLKTDYSYPGTESGFAILDYFANEDGKTNKNASLVQFGKIKNITADDVVNAITDSGEYDSSWFNSTVRDADRVDATDEKDGWPNIDCAAYYTKDQDWKRSTKDQVKDDMWTLTFAYTSKAITNDTKICLSKESILTDGESADGEGVADTDKTKDYLGKPSGATLTVDKSDTDNKIIYTLYVYWNIGDNVVSTEYSGFTDTSQVTGKNIQTVDPDVFYVQPKKAYNERMAYDLERLNKDRTIYKYKF